MNCLLRCARQATLADPVTSAVLRKFSQPLRPAPGAAGLAGDTRLRARAPWLVSALEHDSAAAEEADLVQAQRDGALPDSAPECQLASEELQRDQVAGGCVCVLCARACGTESVQSVRCVWVCLCLRLCVRG